MVAQRLGRFDHKIGGIEVIAGGQEGVIGAAEAVAYRIIHIQGEPVAEMEAALPQARAAGLLVMRMDGVDPAFHDGGTGV